MPTIAARLPAQASEADQQAWKLALRPKACHRKLLMIVPSKLQASVDRGFGDSHGYGGDTQFWGCFERIISGQGGCWHGVGACLRGFGTEARIRSRCDAGLTARP